MRFTLEVLGGAALLLLISAWVPAPAAAQAPVRAESPWTAEASAPRWPAPGDSIAQSAALLPSRAVTGPAVQAKDKDTGLTLMIVGGALFVGGLVIGDDGGTILAVAGLGIGAYGLYLYVD